MDVLLTHGYCLAEDSAEREIMRPHPPLGLLYVAAHLRAKGFTVEVADTTFGSLEATAARIRATRPSVVGIYANLMTRKNVLRLIRECRLAELPVVVGGPDPAPWAREYLRAGADFVAEGEGERTLEELIPRLQRDGSDKAGLLAVSGLSWLAGGEVVSSGPRDKIRELDAQPFPARDLIEVSQYLSAWRDRHGYGAVSIITARGCPFRCDWCSHTVFGHSHRRRSVKNVADEVELIRATFAPDRLWYADDVFTINRRWFFEYEAELTRRGLNTPFETITREDCLDEDVLAGLARMSCQKLWIGAESGSQRVLDAMSRKTDAARMREMVKAARRHGISVGTFVMVGYEGEELADIEATVEHLVEAMPDQVLTTVAYPIKGTGYFEKVKDRVVPLRAWSEGSDRDHTVLGRKSRRYYEHARDWIVHSVEQKRLESEGRRFSAAKHFVRATKAKLAMAAAEHEVERGE
ncbi:MAG: cobalamin B12-binding domain-containing protein [Deltaproteobacteria bacterium]|nr:cobalamin B12-binding domain-containing protein [Deltaproteobacteria bacterium]